MGKKRAESFKEKSFMPAPLFFCRVSRPGAALFLSDSAFSGAEGKCSVVKSLHDSVKAKVYGAFG